MLQSDGEIVASGEPIGAFPATHQSAIARYDANGTLDASFGSGGKVVLPSGALLGRGLALQTDGRILVAGIGNAINESFALARYDANGSLDVGFDADGKLEVDSFGFQDRAENLLVQPDGRIVLGGLARGSVDGYGLARVNP